MTAVTAPAQFPDSTAELRLPGPAGALEVAVDLPEPELARAGTAIFCHPHPLHSGTMHNKVVTMAERSLRELGLRTVRFNFRGVGASEGQYDDGRGETLDLLAVAEWVRKVRPNDALWLCGFSFGSYVALLGARHLPVKQMVSIAPPAGRWDFSAVLPPTCPWLVVQGEEDDVVTLADVMTWARPQKLPVEVIPGAGHFFHGDLLTLQRVIRDHRGEAT